MPIGFIYVITNLLDGSQYVGQTRLKSVDERFKKHKTTARYPRNPTLLYNAMNRDGYQNFNIQELVRIERENLEALKDSLGNLEAYFAEQYNSYSRMHVDCSYNMTNTIDGYNMTPCGRGWASGRIVPDYERKALAERMRNRIITEATRKKISETNLKNPREWTQAERDAVGNRMKGIRRTEKEKEAIRNAKKGKKRRPDECAAISRAKKGKPLTEIQAACRKKFIDNRFDKLFQNHLEQFMKDPSSEKQWRYDMTRKKRDGKLDEKYINILNNTPDFSWSS